MESASTLIRSWSADFLGLLFPPLCPVCGGHAGSPVTPRRAPLCQRCWDSIPWLGPPWCDVCGTPFTAFADRMPEAAVSPGAFGRCGRCLIRPPAFAYARSGARYEGPVREALHVFKFSRKVALAEPLSALLLHACADTLPGPADVVVPVPLHRARERERGFNQAGLLARRLARSLQAGLGERVLGRARATAAQADLDGAERRANVRGAFILRDPGAVRGRHVVLVDDVLTTGATVRECARTLQAGGAATVGILTVARVV